MATIKYTVDSKHRVNFDCPVCFNGLRAIGYLANQRVTVLGNIYQNKELVEE